MSTAANPHRGEASLDVRGTAFVLRPSFAALVASEEEFGSLFALVERAAAGQLRIAELAGLFWHCLDRQGQVTREDVCDAVISAGLAGCATPLRALLAQILQGRG